MSDPIEPAPEPDLDPRASWTGVATGAGLALATVAALSVLGVLSQGFVVAEKTSLVYKMGIAFLRNLDYTPAGIMAVLALALVAAPALAGTPTTARQNRQAAIAFGLVIVTCLVVVFGSVLGVITRLHFDQQITSATRRVLATFVVRSMGPALVAFGAAVALLQTRFPRPVTPAPYAAGEGGEPSPQPGPGAGAP
jgi:hypothetical protein